MIPGRRRRRHPTIQQRRNSHARTRSTGSGTGETIPRRLIAHNTVTPETHPLLHLAVGDALARQEGAQPRVLPGDAARRLLHLVRRLHAAPLVLVHALLQLVDQLLPAGARGALVISRPLVVAHPVTGLGGVSLCALVSLVSWTNGIEKSRQPSTA